MPAKPAPKKNLSALKRVRQAEKQKLRNASIRSRIKTLSKKVEEAVSQKNNEQVASLLKQTAKTISTAVSKGVLHKNTAARKISRLSKLANAALKSAAA